VLQLASDRASAEPASVAQTTRTDILGLISQTPVVEPDANLTIRVRVTGAPSGSTIRVDVHGRVPTRTDFQASLQGKNLRASVPGSPVNTPATPDEAGTVVVNIATRDTQSTTPADPSLPTVRLGEGVFPVTIALVDGRTTIQQLLTYMVRLPVTHEFAPLDVAVVLPIGGSPALKPDGSTQLDDKTKDDVVSSASVLSAHEDVPLTIAATAETVDALDPASADAVKTAASGRQLSLTPYVRLRPSEWVSSNLTDELTAQFERGTRSLSTTVEAPTASVFVADDRLTSDAARFLHTHGVTSMVVPDDALTGLDEKTFNRALTQPFTLQDTNGVEAVAADSALAAHVGSTGDGVIDANHLVADLSVLYFDDPPDRREATFVLPEDRSIDSQFLDSLLESLSPSVNRILQPITLSTLFATIPMVGSRGETNGRGTPLVRGLTPKPSDDLSSFARKLRSTNSDLASYRLLAITPNPKPDEFDRRALVAGANGLTNDERSSYLDNVVSSVRGELTKIEPPPRQTINFTARDGVVSLTFKLNTGYPVAIDVFLQGEKLEFPGHEDGHIALTLTDPTTRVPVNVRTRASGDSALDITLQTPDGGMLIGRTRMTVRSTAFSGVGVVLSVGAIAFLAIWWGRSILQARRARRRPRHAAP
jgi:hypothetical protein